MFQRFTDRARRVIVLAQEEARGLSHDYIGTEHLLLSLTAERGGVAGRALASMGVSVDGVRAEVVQLIGRGQSMPAEHLPFTPRAKKVLELSLREALQLGHSHIGSGHILLGVSREGEGVAAHVLVKMGADHDRVRRRVVELLRVDGEAEPAPEREPDPLPETARSAEAEAAEPAAEPSAGGEQAGGEDAGGEQAGQGQG